MGDEAGLSDYQDTGNMCYPGEVKTAFATAESIDSMKEMLAGAQPQQVIDVAEAWKNIHDHLVSGSGSVKGDFDRAVEHVLQHWEGESADEFAKKARQISKSIADCATYASRTSTVMRNAGQQLSDIKPKVDAIEKPSGLSSAMDKVGDGFSRDEDWQGEITNNQGAQQALDNHDGSLSAGKEEQLKAAALMETLALTYTSQAQTMGSWNRKPPPRDGRGDHGDYPGDPGGVAPVPLAVTSGGSSPSGAAAAGTARASSAVGAKAPKTASPNVSAKPGAATQVDGIKGGTPTTVPSTGGGAKSVGPTAGVTGGPSASSGPVGGGSVGGPGFVGKASGNRSVTGAGAGSRTGIGGARGGAGQRVAGGIGAGGRGGAAGGVGNRGGKNVAGRGPLAKSRGGVLDTPEQGKGAARQGGAGLHSSRGGAMAGERGRNAGGVMGRGGVAGNNARRKQDKNDQGERPDYLVEDEETWMPERRDVAPPTVG